MMGALPLIILQVGFLALFALVMILRRHCRFFSRFFPDNPYPLFKPWDWNEMPANRKRVLVKLLGIGGMFCVTACFLWLAQGARVLGFIAFAAGMGLYSWILALRFAIKAHTLKNQRDVNGGARQ